MPDSLNDVFSRNNEPYDQQDNWPTLG